VGWAVVYLVAAYFFAWWPFDDGTLPLSNYEDVDVNTYYFPDGREAYLGKMRGASACGAASHSYAKKHQISDQGWSYVCCTARKGSECYEKIQ
jgi:hypothetical protein